ncbi:MAG: hypothetical protein A2381_16235 [Bdellovibrionales bacterium RIFOXYB1_FULL_37_110]|nr:MAG: hypothetical protein A2181_06340 [Bdellovibrionales bacterium RIFOXYA1_FULL_38_20]OFZ48491.1 MAG: hypothetical protein A2417_04095 [Bdellovibrionales bacterium RIFOXYC1_FULL_37_79]OFZ57170.1 MAG: hypothetical protein A2381_16235 [Bdellovibrionales bacterium RIFOXYB1_FULL_37_110]OFZ63149.1 MAG: hypothetical protein A2577_15735 [Bdellovibrionales bacterium RIFOXYD1_FULL_36_51]
MDDKTKKDKIQTAIEAHFAWFDRLKQAIATQKSEFKPEVVAKDNQCEFGKWIYSDLQTICDEKLYLEIKTNHAEFHKKASEALSLALQGKIKDAEERIAFGGELIKLSGKLVLLLKKI